MREKTNTWDAEATCCYKPKAVLKAARALGREVDELGAQELIEEVVDGLGREGHKDIGN